MSPARAAHGSWSLRNRLLAIGVFTGALAWLVGGIAVYRVVRIEDEQLFDARLHDIAQTLLVFADHELAEIAADGGSGPMHIDTEGTSDDRYLYQVWSQDGRLMLSSANAPTDAPLVPLAQRGWATRELAGQTLRVIALPGPSGRYLIQAAEPESRRLGLDDLINPGFGVELLLSVLVLAALALLLRQALKPLQRASDVIGERGPADLRRVDAHALPSEFTPVFEGVNRLLERLDVALRSEREFVSAAAHELRTPLAGVQAQAQLAAHERTPPAERQQALRAIEDGVDRLAHLINQLLDIARSDALAGDASRLRLARRPVDVQGLFDAVLVDLGPSAAERGVCFRRQFDEPSIEGSAFGLQLMLRNLLANAIAHTAEASEIQLGCRRAGDAVVLWVSDRGPGIAPHERERVFERFYRVKGTRTAGCGLGLAIVKSLADAHGATVRLGDAPGGGLLVEVAFPAEI